MFYTRFAKKIICLFIVGILVLNPVAVRALSTGTLNVSGGTITGSGSRMGAIAILMMIANSLGFTFHLSQAAKDAGQTVSDWLDDELSEWEAIEKQKIDIIKQLSSGSSGGGGSGDDSGSSEGSDKNKVGKNGKIYIAAGALAIAQKFFNWLNSRGKISTTVIIPGEFVGDTLYSNGAYPVYKSINQQGQYQEMYSVFPAVKRSDGKFYNVKTGVIALVLTDVYRTNNIAFAFFAPGNIFTDIQVQDSPLWYCSKSNAFPVVNEQATGLVGGNHKYNDWLFSFAGGSDGRYTFCNVPPGIKVLQTTNREAENAIKAYLDNVNWEVGSSEDDSYIEGDYNSSDLDNPDGKYTEIDPQLLPGMAEQVNGDATIDIEQYLKAIIESINKKSNPSYDPNPVDATDESTLENVPLEVPQAETYPSKFPEDQETEVEPPADAEPINLPDKVPEPEQALPLITFDLREYFPFCLPFDCYDIVSKFVADPVAPVFDIPFNEPFSGAQTVIHVDLSPFDSMMVNVRNAELIAFVVGLALVTRSMFAK